MQWIRNFSLVNRVTYGFAALAANIGVVGVGAIIAMERQSAASKLATRRCSCPACRRA